jgi:AcrR family transcriptional regulator
MAEKKKPKQPSARVARKRQQARHEILDAALRLLHDEGLDAVTLASVAGELGMTKQALYHYFPSKEAMVRSLVTTLLDEEIETLITAVEVEKDTSKMLGALIRAFYDHYIHRLDAFRIVYCQSQLYAAPDLGMDPDTIRDEINPRTRRLFDVLEARMTESGASKKERRHSRQLAFTAWSSALGLLTMLSVADATDDPLIHPDKALLDTLAGVFAT